MAIIQKLFKIFTSNFNTIWGTYRPISAPRFTDGAIIGTNIHTCSPPTQMLFSLLLHLDIYLYI